MNAPDAAFAEVCRAIRTQRVAQEKPDFWLQHRRALAGNHEALFLAAWCVLRAHDLNVQPSEGMIDRLRAALEQKEALDAGLSAHVNGSALEAA